MIIDFRDYKNIDFKKYKRVFIFGCSFTHYCWPTWANIIALETPDAEVYNFGQPGGGNLFIAERVIAANQKFKFNDNDLLLIMWSTFSREDRYIDTGWETPGNIFTQGFYPEEFVKKFVCVKGCIVRDLAIITMLRNSLQTYTCDSIMFKSVDPDYDKRLFLGSDFDDVIELYRDVIYSMGLSLYHFSHNGRGGWTNGHLYHWSSISYSTPDNPFQDYHPNPKMYMDFLTGSDISLSQSTKDRVLEYNQNMLEMKERGTIEQYFKDFCKTLPKYKHTQHLI